MKAADSICGKLVERLASSHGLRVGRPGGAGLLARLLGRRLDEPEYGAYCNRGRLVVWLAVPAGKSSDSLELEAREILEENFHNMTFPPEYSIWKSRGHIIIELSEDVGKYPSLDEAGEETLKLALLTAELHLGFLKMVEGLIAHRPRVARGVGVELA